MNPIDFKNNLMQDEDEIWTEFPCEEVEQSNLNDKTKAFLKVGFPESASPGLGFGLRSYNGKFHNIGEYYSEYDLADNYKNYWIFGFDYLGNFICIDASNNDNIILIEDEKEFKIVQQLNKNISELASSILLFSCFINKVIAEFGEDGYLRSKFSEKHIADLENEFEKLNPNYCIESSFWNSELENLKADI